MTGLIAAAMSFGVRPRLTSRKPGTLIVDPDGNVWMLQEVGHKTGA